MQINVNSSEAESFKFIRILDDILLPTDFSLELWLGGVLCETWRIDHSLPCRLTLTLTIKKQAKFTQAYVENSRSCHNGKVKRSSRPRPDGDGRDAHASVEIWGKVSCSFGPRRTIWYSDSHCVN